MGKKACPRRKVNILAYISEDDGAVRIMSKNIRDVFGVHVLAGVQYAGHFYPYWHYNAVLGILAMLKRNRINYSLNKHT